MSTAGSTQPNNAKLCIVIHAYYLDVLNEIYAYLKFIPIPFTLCIGVSNVVAKHAVEKSVGLSGFNGPFYCDILPNRGRNFSTFFYYSPVILQHEIVLHLHTKKSQYNSIGRDWMRSLVQGLIGTRRLAETILENFDRHPRLGLVYPATFEALPYWAHHWLKNLNSGMSLLDRLGVRNYPTKGYFAYPVGGMFWARVESIRGILQLGLRHADFEEERGQLDGTLAHAIERVLGILVKARGYDYLEHDARTNQFRGNWSTFNLEQYSQNTTELFYSRVKRSKLVSFDIFDTLFVRPSLEPDSVMSYTERRLDKELHGHSDFFQKRKAAEFRARKRKNWSGDVSLGDIYREFEISGVLTGSNLHLAQDLEKDFDLSLLQPRNEVVDLLRGAKKIGARVILVSDTYYSQSDIVSLLKKAGLLGYTDRIYLSSEFDARKDRGDLWERVFQEEACQPHEILHVGDNEQSDIQQICDRNGNTFHVINPTVAFELDVPGIKVLRRSEHWPTDLVMGPVALALEKNPFRNRNPIQRPSLENASAVGYSVFGPIIWKFFSWLANSPSFQELDTVYFLSREGHILHKIYDMLKSAGTSDLLKPKGVYLLTSRKAALRASMSMKLVPAEIVRGFAFQGRVGDLLDGRIGVQLKNPDQNARVVTLPRHNSLVCDIIDQNSVCIKDALRNEGYAQYLRDMGLFGQQSIGLVDIGYSGTIQFHLQELLNKGVQGFYFATTPTARRLAERGGVAHACFESFSEMQSSSNPIMKYSILMEAFLSSSSPGLSSFAEGISRGPIYNQEMRNQEEISILSEMHDGVERFISDLLSAYGPELLLHAPDSATVQQMLEALAKGRFSMPADVRNFFWIDDTWYGVKRQNGLT